MDLIAILIILLIAAVVFWLAGAFGLPSPLPAIAAAIVLILGLIGKFPLNL